jgi:hypothetical protein
MAKVVCVHGIAAEYEAAETLEAVWTPALRGGVGLAGGQLEVADVRVAFYGVLFRPPGKGDGDIPPYVPGDVEAGLERELLEDWAAAAEEIAPDRTESTKGQFAQRSAAALVQLVGNTPYFGKVAQKVVIWQLKQVSGYLKDDVIRTGAQQAVLDAVSADTRVLVGHSLGSVVAFETLHAHPDLPVHTLVTLGSPLGAPALHGRLRPEVTPPTSEWPPGVRRWTNVADATDVVALQKRLSRVFGTAVDDHLVHNGATMHSIEPYLTAVETGEAIQAGLQDP